MSEEESQNYESYKSELEILVRGAAIKALSEPLGDGLPSVVARITSIETVMQERNRVAENNGKWLAAVAVAVILQFLFSIFSVGVKFNQIETLKDVVTELRGAFNAHQAADLVWRDQNAIRLQSMRTEIEKEIYDHAK